MNLAEREMGDSRFDEQHQAVIEEAIKKGVIPGEYWEINNSDDYLVLGRTFDPDKGISNIESDTEKILDIIVFDINEGS